MPLRALGIIAWSAASLGLMALGLALSFPSPRARGAWRRVVVRGWGRGLAAILGLSIEVDGTAPAPPFFLVSNHLSYVDAVVYAAVAPGRFVAKREVRGWPGIGFLAWMAGTIFIDRGAPRDALRVQHHLAAAYAAGEGVLVFAEATSSEGRTVLPFRPALLDWAARTARPVHHASISYRTPAGAEPAHRSICWWGDMTFGPHFLGLCRLPSATASVTFGAASLTGEDRRALATALQRAVAGHFIPVVGD